MKLKIFLATVFVIIIWEKSLAFSQDRNNSDLDEYSACEVILNDGTKLNGYITLFLERSANIDSEDAIHTSPEKLYNLIDKEFVFKTDAASERKIYKQKDVKQVTLFYGQNINPITYKVLDLKQLDNNGVIKESSKNLVWLPVYKEDIISIYSIIFWTRNSYEKLNGTTKYSKKRHKFLTLTYLSNQKENHAFALSKPFDDNLSNFLNSKKYTFTVLKQIFKDCPNFIEKITKNNKFNDDLYQLSTSEIKNKISDTKKNKTLSEDEKNMVIDELTRDMDNEIFVKLIEDYKSTCKY